jgi:hypothetical protein
MVTHRRRTRQPLGYFLDFSWFIFMQENDPKSTGITGIIFWRKTTANHGHDLTCLSAMQPPTSCNPYYKLAQITQQHKLDVGCSSPEARTSINPMYAMFAQPSEARHAIQEIIWLRLANPDNSQPRLYHRVQTHLLDFFFCWCGSYWREKGKNKTSFPI